jgi:hypothetical protein
MMKKQDVCAASPVVDVALGTNRYATAGEVSQAHFERFIR